MTPGSNSAQELIEHDGRDGSFSVPAVSAGFDFAMRVIRRQWQLDPGPLPVVRDVTGDNYFQCLPR